MEIQAILCDAASVRDNLLFVMGGGITRLWRDRFPAKMGVDLAVMLTVDPGDQADRHHMRVMVNNQDGTQIAGMEAEFGFGVTVLPDNHLQAPLPGELLIVPLVVPLRELVLPASDMYSMEITIDDDLHKSVWFRAALNSGVAPS